MFTADGEEWRKKRATVSHSLFRGIAVTASGGGVAGTRGVVGGDGGGGRAATGGSGKALAVLANEEADSLLREVETLREEGGEVSGGASLGLLSLCWPVGAHSTDLCTQIKVVFEQCTAHAI